MRIEFVGVPTSVDSHVGHLTLVGAVQGNRALVNHSSDLKWSRGGSDRGRYPCG
jgi:hypothetical protein